MAAENCRFGRQEVTKKVDVQHPFNTLKFNKYVWRQFEEFLKVRQYDLKKETPIKQICFIMKDWALNMKRQDGSDYKECVVKSIWNKTAKTVQEMYYDRFNIAFDIFRDSSFKEARDARDNKRKCLLADPTKRKKYLAAFTPDEYQRIIRMWDENTPHGLQRKFFHIASVELAWRGGEAADCQISYFKVDLDQVGQPTGRLQYTPPNSAGTAANGTEKFLVPNVNSPDICPVRIYRQLLDKRSVNITTNRVFLAVNPYWKNGNWYKNIAVGKNEICKWTKAAAAKIGLDTNSFNYHSNRATAINQLPRVLIASPNQTQIESDNLESTIIKDEPQEEQGEENTNSGTNCDNDLELAALPTVKNEEEPAEIESDDDDYDNNSFSNNSVIETNNCRNNNNNNNNICNNRDEFTVYSEYIAHQLRDCGRSKREITIAQHKINEICFQLFMGELQ